METSENHVPQKFYQKVLSLILNLLRISDSRTETVK